MKKLNTPIVTAALMLAVLSGNAMGDAGISYSPTGNTPKPVTADVKFKITIPKLMILRVGDWKDKVNTVEWNYAFGGLGDADIANDRASEDQWNLANGPKPMDADADDDASGSDGVLEVSAFGNIGQDLTLFPTSTDFKAPVADTAQPHLSEITATGGDIPHPKLINTGEGEKVVLKHAKGIVSLQDKWKYTYTPGSTPVGGVYEASVVYTLAAL